MACTFCLRGLLYPQFRFNAPVSTWYNFAKSQSSITCLSLIVYIRFLPLYYPMQKETAHMRSVPRSLQKYTTVKPFQFCSTGFHFLYGRSGGWICYSQRNKYNNFSHVMWFLKSRNRILYVSVKTNGSRVRIIYTEEQTALQNREKIKEIYDRQVDRV